MKTTYTVGEAARMLDMSMKMIQRSIDEGRLRGYRIPGSLHRRVRRAALLAFARQYGIPTDALEHESATAGSAA